MASSLVTPSIEQHCIIKFLLEVKVKLTEILHVLNAQYGECTLLHANVHDWCSKSYKGCKEVLNLLHAYVHPTVVLLLCRRADFGKQASYNV
jgi:hypothetical protein